LLRQKELGYEGYRIHVVLWTLWCCEVRQMYGCADYEPAEDHLLISQTNDTVLLRCAQDSAKTWTLNCVDGRWTTNHDQRPDCRSNDFVKTSADSSLNASTGLDNRGRPI